MIIEINLLPKSYYISKRRKQMGLMLVGIGLILVLLLGGLYVSKLMQVIKIKNKINEVTKEQQKYTAILAQIESIKKDESTLMERKNIYDTLRKEQKIWAEILDKLNKSVPNNLWFTSVTNSKAKGGDRSFTILGSAVSKVAVANFINNLKNSNFFSDVTFETINDTGPGNNLSRISFNVTCKSKE